MTQRSIQAVSLWHFLFSWGVGLAFLTAIFNGLLGLIGAYAIKDTFPKWGKAVLSALIVGGIALPLGSAWDQAHELQQSDLAQRQMAAQIVNAIVTKLPKPSPFTQPLHVTSVVPHGPAITGKIPEVELTYENNGPGPQEMALQYRYFEAHDIDGCFDDFTYRRECEQRFWLQLVNGPNPPLFYMQIPAGQPQETTLTGIYGPVRADQKPTNTRFYFVARAYDRQGKRLFDSCFYLEPNPTPDALVHVTMCLAHND